MSFKSFRQEELFKIAVEEFAVDVKPDDSKTVILAALEEDGVTWDMYLKNHPELASTGKDKLVDKREGTAVETATPKIKTKVADVDTSTEELYLIKMDRDNPRFEFGRYKFTQEHPFAVMPSADADRILSQEQGFSIATPSEAAEYYQRG